MKRFYCLESFSTIQSSLNQMSNNLNEEVLTRVVSKEQIENCYLCFKRTETPTDFAITYRHYHGELAILNENDMNCQIMSWKNIQEEKNLSFFCLEKNNLEVNTNDGKTWYILVVQHINPNSKLNEEEIPNLRLCPMSLFLFEINVNGYVYAFKNKKNRDKTFDLINNLSNIVLVENKTELKNIIQRDNIRREKRQFKITLQEEKVKADEAEAKLLADLEAEENKKSSPKKKKEKKVKEAKVQVNPHKKEIRVSEGIWKPNPAWKKWEQENKRSASPP